MESRPPITSSALVRHFEEDTVNAFPTPPPYNGDTSARRDQQPDTVAPKPSRRRLLRIAAWLAAGITVLLLLVAVTATILLNSARFHEYVLSTVQKQATESLGVPVTLQNF